MLFDNLPVAKCGYATFKLLDGAQLRAMVNCWINWDFRCLECVVCFDYYLVCDEEGAKKQSTKQRAKQSKHP
jgi:hypothetical protein